MTSLLALMVFSVEPEAAAQETPVALSPLLSELPHTILVTVAPGKMAKLDRGGRGSM